MDINSLIIGAVAGVVVGGIAGFLSGKAAAAPATGKTKKTTAPNRKKNNSERSEGANGAELYVGNLSYDIDDAMLKKEFEKCGTVISARVIKNKYNNRSRGYGFVEMASPELADKAVEKTHGKEIMGRKIVVNVARSNSHN